MSEGGAPTRGGRSGCALASGFLLIICGSFLLAVNLFGLSFLGNAARSLEWFVDYWPLVLVIWGVAKLSKRLWSPESSTVSGLEVVVLVLVVVAGLGLTATRRAMNELAVGADWSGLAEVFGPEFLGPRREFVDEQSFPLTPGAPLRVENERGTVRISGWSEDQLHVVVIKYIHDFSDSEARRAADEVQLGFGPHENGHRLRVVASRKRFIETELRIRLPRGVPLDVRTSRSGSIIVQDLDAGAVLTTREGPIEVLRSSGGVRARTNRASIRLEDIAGRTEASTRRGSIVALRVIGDLSARTSSAELLADQITGNVELANRHGRVRIRRVSGSVEVEASDADISIEAAEGPVRIETRRGEVHARDLSSRLDVQARRAIVRATSVAGDVTVEGGDRPITMRQIGGALKVTATRADVSVAGLAGPAIIAGAPDDVSVSDFFGHLTVQSNHGKIRAATTRLAGDVRLQTSYGDIELSLPIASSARFHFSTRDGELRSVFPGIELKAEQVGVERRSKGRLGAGEHEVTLVTAYGDIRLRSHEP